MDPNAYSQGRRPQPTRETPHQPFSTSTAANAPRPRTIKQRPGYGNESDGRMAHSTNNGRRMMIVDQQKTRVHRVRLDRDLDIN
jgi:hypothetical protein